MKSHAALFVGLVCGALAASVPSLKPTEYSQKLIAYRRSLLELNWKIDESKHNLNENLRGILNSCSDGDVDVQAIEEKIHNLRSSYANHIAEYRDSLNSLYSADLEPKLHFAEEQKQYIEANLKKAEANFEKSVEELSSSLEKLKLGDIKVKADGDTSSGTSWFPSWTSIYNNIISYFPNISNNEYFTNVQNTISNWTNNVTSLLNQNQGTQEVNNGDSSTTESVAYSDAPGFEPLSPSRLELPTPGARSL